MRLYLPFNNLRYLVGHLFGSCPGIISYENDLFDHKGSILPFPQVLESEQTSDDRYNKEKINDLFVAKRVSCNAHNIQIGDLTFNKTAI